MKQLQICLIVVLLVASFKIGQCQKKLREEQRRILAEILADNRYDKSQRPGGTNETDDKGKPVIVVVNMLIRSIESIDDQKMQWSTQITFRQMWNDDRLKFDNMNGQISYLTLTNVERIWKPDTFFKNEKEGHFHNMLAPNVLVRIYPGGNVLYSSRLSVTFSCPMHLKYFPADKQQCNIQIVSYGYTEEDIVYVWKESNPVQVTTVLTLPKFSLQKYQTNYCSSKTNTGSYSCLNASFFFHREFNYYLVQIYIPCMMLVIVSWVSFWMDSKKDITARTFLITATLLTMAMMVFFTNATIPQISYTKRIDVWTGVNLTFVFAALLELATVNYVSNHKEISAESRQYRLMKTMQSVPFDCISRVAFPVAYVLFVIIYVVLAHSP